MRNYGDITKISGYEVPPVDVVIGGSPCQDLSVAGLRKGLAGRRSGLFMDQIRIVKEMRENDRMHGRTGDDVRPRFMVWENVCGAFSSNGGKDFLAVLEETAHIADENAVIPEPPQGKWRNAGVVMGNGWSIAWRVHDAQFWGVPQRRRRISLVADFAGGRAPEICFVRKSLSGHPEPCGEKRKEAPGQAVPCAAYTVRERAGCEGGGKGALVQSEKTGTLGCSNDQTLFDFRGGQTVYGISSYESNAMKSSNPESGISEAETARTLDSNGGNPACNQGGMLVYDSRGNGDGTTVPTMTGDHQNRVTDYTAIVLHESGREKGDVARTLTARYDSSFDGSRGQNVVVYSGAQLTSLLNKQNPQPGDPAPTLSIDSRNYAVIEAITLHESAGEYAENASIALRNSDYKHPPVTWWDGKDTVQTITANLADQRMPDKGSLNAFVDFRNGNESVINGTLQAKESGSSSVNYNNTVRENECVRRLTPLECERLQGFPDGWTDIGDWTDDKGKKHKTTDSNRYKALGNSIALPFWKYLLKRISAEYERDATMASLFDGIGGFPYLWEQINGKGSCKWISEIEPFCCALTEKRFI